MIVTEYMENGSLDTFLRVRASLHRPHGLGEGSAAWVWGGDVRSANTPRSLDPRALGKGEPGTES